MGNAVNLRKSRLSRAYEYLRYNGYIKTQRDLAEVMHTAPPNISNAMRGSDKVLTNGSLVRLNSAFNGIFNENWLLYGEGEMLANPQPNDKCLINASNNVYSDGASGNNNITIASPEQSTKKQRSQDYISRPIVTKSLATKPNTDVYLVVKQDGNTMEHLAAFQQYSNFDFYYQVRQDAMQPLYWQGDVLALAHLKPDTTIIQGAAMVIDTKDFGFLLRNIYDRGDYYECRCVNENSKFETQNISKDNVIRLYRVVYSVRLGD